MLSNNDRILLLPTFSIVPPFPLFASFSIVFSCIFWLVAFHRYIPLSRSKVPLSTGSWLDSGSSFPSLSSSDEIMKSNSSSLILCKYGSVEAVAKVYISCNVLLWGFDWFWMLQPSKLFSPHMCPIVIFSFYLFHVFHNLT